MPELMQMDLLGGPDVPMSVLAARSRAGGAVRAVADKAEAAIPGWTAMAVAALREWAAGQAGLFTVEMAREAIADRVPQPHDLRAWGAVTLLAIRDRVIAQVPRAFAGAASSNGSLKPMYRRGAGASGKDGATNAWRK